MNAQTAEFSKLLSENKANFYANEDVFERVRKVYNNPPSSCTLEDKKLLEETYRSFVRSGASLKAEDKKQFKELCSKESALSVSFGQNLLKQASEYELHLTKDSDLLGLPERVKEQAFEEARLRNKKGWVFTMDAPSYGSFMEHSDCRDLRERYYRSYAGSCVSGPYSNQNNIKEIIKIRQKKSQLLGYKDYPTYILEERMAKTPEKVWDFLKELKTKCYEPAKSEFKELCEFAATCGLKDSLRPWDVAYYANKLKVQKFDFDPEALRPYFSLEQVMKGLFSVAKRLYGLEIKPNTDLPKYHEDVLVYEVYQHDTYYGLLYLDLFPRKTKRSGAWQSTFRVQGQMFSELRRPHVSIVCNFTKPTQSKPSLLSFREVETLFHEFGHSLHSLLSCCTYTSLAGTSVDWDFVELPSQIMENWPRQEEVLKDFAFHYKTKKPLSVDLIQKLKKSELFMAGCGFLRQVYLSALDMHWHSLEALEAKDVMEFENKILQQFSFMDPVENCSNSTSFSHIFAGGYSAGYYSYKWAEVLEADAFEVFEKEGLFNSETSSRFESCILSKGGTENSDVLYKSFRGSDPKVEPLLRKYGLLI